MAQLVFVHGVATRPGAGYEQAEANRNTLLQRVVFRDTKVHIRSPLWGDLVPAADPEVFDTAKVTASFSLGGEPEGGGLMGGGEEASAGDGTATVAQANAATAIDAVFAQLVERADAAGELLDESDIAAFVQATDALAAGSAAKLIGSAGSDDEVAFALGTDAGSYSIGGRIRDAVGAVTDRVRNTASTLAFGTVRGTLSPAVAFFLGDVFAYLNGGSLREQIRTRVRDALLAAHAARGPGEPLIVVCHSMGGVILLDMLTDPQAGLPGDLRIDALFTVGSQPGLFQSLGALTGGVAPGGLRPRPAAVQLWYNVFDPIDPLAFRADPVFADVRDVEFDSITGLASAHTTYFKRPQFYARFRYRLQEKGLCG